MANNRTCHVCGKRYYFCSSYNCEQSRDKPRWMVMFDEENCKQIWDATSERFFKVNAANNRLAKGEITSDECSKQISKATKDAAILLKCLDLSHLETFVPQVKKDIEEILNSPEAKELDAPSVVSDSGCVVAGYDEDKESNKHSRRKKDIM